MFVAPSNPNVVVVQMTQTGCCSIQFDQTYPIHLNGIISQHEFQQSIDNINRSISSRLGIVLVIFFAAIFIVVGMILFIVGGITATSSGSRGFPVLIGVAIGIMMFGMIVFPFICICFFSKRMANLQKAILQESIKYSNRSSNPCSWRLNTTRFYTGFYNNRSVQTSYQILIEIGNRNPTMNYSALVDPTRVDYSTYQNPPPYNQINQQYCSQCGTVLNNPTANFCSTCGHKIH